MIKIKNKSSGFTLIELLVVIAIIGLLASVVLVSLNNVRTKARNTNRISNLTQVQKALELYATDNNGTYPDTGFTYRSTCAGYTVDQVIPNLTPKYLAKIPTDLQGACYYYVTNNAGKNYKFFVTNVSSEDNTYLNNNFPQFMDPGRDNGAQICVIEAPAWSWGVYNAALSNDPCPNSGGAGL